MSWWIPALLGAFLATVLAAIWLAALRKLLEKQQQEIQPQVSIPIQIERSSEALKPIASFLDPDEDEPNTPLPSQSRAPLSFNRYIEVRGAIKGWRGSGMDVDFELSRQALWFQGLKEVSSKRGGQKLFAASIENLHN